MDKSEYKEVSVLYTIDFDTITSDNENKKIGRKKIRQAHAIKTLHRIGNNVPLPEAGS